MSSVNGKKVNIPSYRVKEGDVIEVRDRSKQLAIVLEAAQLAERDVPDYLNVDQLENDCNLRPHSGPVGHPLPGDDGTEPRHRILRTELIYHHV